MMLELEDDLEEEAIELEPCFAPAEVMRQMEDADERRRNALAERLQNTTVGRALAKIGGKITIEKAPPRYPAAHARGQSGFEVYCGGRQPQTNVVFGLYDQDRTTSRAAAGKSLAFYLFSSTVDPKSHLECKRSGVTPVARDPFGVVGAADALHGFKNEIGVEQLVSDAKSPSATIFLDTATARDHISCALKLNTKSNGVVRISFGLRKITSPARANVTIPGKVFFLEVGPFDIEKFRNALAPFGPLGKAEMIAKSNF